MNHEFYMRRALELALRGTGFVAPNPRVGCVIVRDGEIISEGWHKSLGENHAEVDAYLHSNGDISGSTVYVNLEPCSHFGRTPPCANLLIEKGVRKVVISNVDPNPVVKGTGIQRLRDAGIEVEIGILEKEGEWLNRTFFKYITTRLPYVIAKVGQSLDGSIATVYGQSQWITSQESLRRAHALRAEVDAIIVGERTAAKDDPELSVRLTKGRNPLRVLLDTNLSAPLKLKLFTDKERTRTIVFCKKELSKSARSSALELSGVQVIPVPSDEFGKVNLSDVLYELGKKGVSSVLVEGGALLLSSFIANSMIDELHLFIAPKVIGKGLRTFQELTTKSLQDAKLFEYKFVDKSGDDIHAVLIKTHN